MQSPFPGMDPYLEFRWGDFHGAVIIYARERLNSSLPLDPVARSEDRVYVEAGGDRVRSINPDVRVSTQAPESSALPVSDPTGVAVAQSVVIELESEPVTEHFIEIVEADGERVVTAIELISPWNKRPGPGRDAYLKKRDEFLDSHANLVEIDLVRGGDWVEMRKPYHVPPNHRTTYRVSVRRASRSDKADLYPITLRQRLPVIAIPLRDGDPSVSLNLQELRDRAYETGRYGATDYRRDCDPPLAADDAAWADRLLRDAGRR